MASCGPFCINATSAAEDPSGCSSMICSFRNSCCFIWVFFLIMQSVHPISILIIYYMSHIINMSCDTGNGFWSSNPKFTTYSICDLRPDLDTLISWFTHLWNGGVKVSIYYTTGNGVVLSRLVTISRVFFKECSVCSNYYECVLRSNTRDTSSSINFTNFNVHWNHLGIFLSCRFWLQFRYQTWGSEFLISYQVLQKLQVHRPCLESSLQISGSKPHLSPKVCSGMTGCIQKKPGL